MRKLLVLVGLQGAGKTTALISVKNATVLRPSTSRAKRATEVNEYHFEPVWDANLMAWSIDRGADKYGMRNTELDLIRDVAITVFDPKNISVLQAVKASLNLEVITVGLDTIDTLAIQNVRVQNDAKRLIDSQSNFDIERAAVLNCDVVLSGDAQKIDEGLNAVIHLVSGRGGLLDAETIKKFIDSGTLLIHADSSQIETASYDLRLADTYWCQGKYVTVSNNQVILIPAYSFVLVQAQEEACLPRFVAGSFDLTVSMFFDGLILSNGPQVDPGYRGALFCMLYNTSDNPVPLNRGIKFATMQFCTTVRVADGYAGQYQSKRTFQDFVSGKTAISPGGKVLERMAEMDDRIKVSMGILKSDLDKNITNFLVLFGIAVTIIIGFVVYAYIQGDKASSAAEKAVSSSEKADTVVAKLLKLGERLEKIEIDANNKMQNKNAIDPAKEVNLNRNGH